MEMAERWDLIRDLLGGTSRMREVREKHLPREPAEQASDYQVRLERSFLYEATGDTIDKVSAKPFEQPIVIKNDELPEMLQGIAENSDLTGMDLNVFAKGLMKDGVARGLTHILVDVAQNPDRRVDLNSNRPFFEHIKAEDIIAHAFEYDPRVGEKVLSRLRYRYTRTEPVPGSEFGQVEVQYIKEWTRTHWRRWARADGGEWLPGPWEEHTFRTELGGGIPLVTCYLERDGLFRARPPFRKLAELNKEHWQKCSDHTNLGRFAAVGTLFLAGIEETDKDGRKRAFSWGPRNTIIASDPAASASIVEHSGSALATLENHILRIEERMEVMGLEPFMRKTGSETATGKALHVGKSDSAIKDWLRSVEQALADAYVMAGEWLSKRSGTTADVAVPEDWRPRLFSDFKVPVLKGVDDTQQLITIRGAEQISHVTFIDELKRRGILSEDVDAESERELMDEEMPTMPPPTGATGGDQGNADQMPDVAEDDLDGAA